MCPLIEPWLLGYIGMCELHQHYYPPSKQNCGIVLENRLPLASPDILKRLAVHVRLAWRCSSWMSPLFTHHIRMQHTRQRLLDHNMIIMLLKLRTIFGVERFVFSLEEIQAGWKKKTKKAFQRTFLNGSGCLGLLRYYSLHVKRPSSASFLCFPTTAGVKLRKLAKPTVTPNSQL